MPWSIEESPQRLEAEFDRYRDRIASVEADNGQQVGYLITYAQRVEQLVGFRGLRPRLRPTEVFKGWSMPNEDRADEVWPLEVGDLDSGRWDGFRLRWLAGAERAAAWNQYLGEWGPHESSQLHIQ